MICTVFDELDVDRRWDVRLQVWSTKIEGFLEDRGISRAGVARREKKKVRILPVWMYIVVAYSLINE